MLRFEAGRDPLDTTMTALIGELSTYSREFRKDWAARNVHEHRTGRKLYHHPEVGRVEVAFDVFQLAGELGLSVCTYTVDEDADSADKFRVLASWAATRELATRPDGPV